jgi:hypothetical protein
METRLTGLPKVLSRYQAKYVSDEGKMSSVLEVKMHAEMEMLFALLICLKRLAHEFPLREAQPPL